MIVKPRIRGFICTTAHPEGCRANVESQIAAVAARGAIAGARNALVIGCSGGFGLASRIDAAFGCGANTIGISFEKAPSAKRTASAGWYNNRAFEAAAKRRGVYARTFDGDAFADEMREQVVAAIVADLGQIDLLVYSLAAPLRVHPHSGERHRSAIKPLGEPFAVKTLDVGKGEVRNIVLDPASEEEAAATVQVMGGEDWELWIDALQARGALARGFQTVAFSYLGQRSHGPYLPATARWAAPRPMWTAPQAHSRRVLLASVVVLAWPCSRPSSAKPARPFQWCLCTCRSCFA